jgi:threonylcarbamoyladenosine tRNA methylthiotransferase MtaB
VVPHVRGRSRSLPTRLALAQLDELITAGYQEIVLTGIHLGQWGKDLEPSHNLSELLLQIDSSNHPPRLRLSSLEPGEIDSTLISLFSSLPWICPHLHIPLQSGDPDILKRMRRPYSPGQYADLIARIHAALPHVAIGADVLTGFPGETEKQFENTLLFLNDLPVSYLHVFPFSPRPGTPAAGFSDQIQGRELKRRANMLQELGRQKRLAFRTQFIGQKLEVLIETEFEPGLWEGLSGNYIKVIFPTAEGITPGSIQVVKISRFRGEDLEGSSTVKSEE